MASAHDVAAAVLDAAGPMSTMKLQKLVYYSQAWSLVWDEVPLFDEQIQAWAGGPVVRELYNHHRGLFSVSEWPKGDAGCLTDSERETVLAVVDAYGPLSGQELSRLTHSERPWIEARAGLPDGARANRPIKLDVMVDFYSGLDASNDPDLN